MYQWYKTKAYGYTLNEDSVFFCNSLMLIDMQCDIGRLLDVSLCGISDRNGRLVCVSRGCELHNIARNLNGKLDKEHA